MTIQITNMRGWVLGLVVVAGAGCRDTIENEDHCWVAKGDQTCMELFGGGFCSNDHKDCEGYEVPYGCVFEKPRTDECYSPNGNNASCAGSDPAPECTEVAGESGESGMSGMSESSESSESSEGSETSQTAECGDGMVEGTEECDDDDGDDMDECTNVCTLPVCGDGIKSPGAGEDCDGPNALGDKPCTANCQWVGTVIWDVYYSISDVDDDVGYEVEIDTFGNIDILVGDGDAYRVLQLSGTGAPNWDVHLSAWDSAPQTNLAVGAEGQVIVGGVASDHGRVDQLESDGSPAWDYDMDEMGENSAVLAVDVDANGHVVAAGYRGANPVLFRVNENGIMEGDDGGTAGQFGPIAVGADGQIRVYQKTSDTGGFLRLFDSAGTVVDQLAPVGATDARAMSLDSSSNVFLLTQAGTVSYTLSKFDTFPKFLWGDVRGTEGAEEEANGVAVLSNGGALVAGNVGAPGQPRGKLSWFSPLGEDILQLVIPEDAVEVAARLYDVAVSPEGDGVAVAVGSRKVGAEPMKLWVRKFAI